MRAASPASLQNTLTTFCFCWLLCPKNQAPLGLTDHDSPLEWNGQRFFPKASFESFELQKTATFRQDQTAISGAFTSEHISETALLSGIFDHARLEIWAVNWKNVSERVLLRVGMLGEIRVQEGKFFADVISSAASLSLENGRLFQKSCDAQLGDKRCALSLEEYQRTALIVSPSPTRDVYHLRVSFPLPASFFAFGTLAFQTGKNEGFSARIQDVPQEEEGLFVLRIDPPAPFGVSVGESVLITAGCDKRFKTCHERFSNAVNFQGFPFIPGTEGLIRRKTPL